MRFRRSTKTAHGVHTYLASNRLPWTAHSPCYSALGNGGGLVFVVWCSWILCSPRLGGWRFDFSSVSHLCCRLLQSDPILQRIVLGFRFKGLSFRVYLLQSDPVLQRVVSGREGGVSIRAPVHKWGNSALRERVLCERPRQARARKLAHSLAGSIARSHSRTLA
jgi:hypothetical protein